jgi:ABC-type dipeptide/oligopeptide/nickel transport system permease subunit
MYLKSFRVTGTTASGGKLLSAARKALNARSFGDAGGFTEAMTVEDGNALVLQEKQVDGADNPSYWTRMTYDRFESNDTFIARADITYDMYLVTYGLRNGMTLSQDKFWDWYKKGYVSWGSGYNWELSGDEDKAEALRALEDLYRDPSTFVIEESGKNSNEVSVTEITNIAKDTNNNQVVYTFTCQVMMYKYLGYNEIPIHIFGTEYQGKDLLKYVFSGLRTSLILGLIVSAINILIGVIWGSISGYYGGAVDITMERITDILGGIPYIVLMTILTIKLGANFFVFALSLCLTGWIGTSATTRSQFYRYRGREYVLASKTLGAKTPTLIFRHILPNAVGTIITRYVLMIPSTIFSEATISYLGLGLSTLDSLGVILSKNQAFLSTYPSELVFPAIIISLLMICFNLFGNGLRDAFNLSLKGTE